MKQEIEALREKVQRWARRQESAEVKYAAGRLAMSLYICANNEPHPIFVTHLADDTRALARACGRHPIASGASGFWRG